MKRILLIILGAALLLSVTAIGCGGGASPGAMIDNAIQNSNNIKSEHLDFNVALNVQGDSSALGAQYQGLLPINLTVDGGADIDSKDQSNPKAQGNFKVGGLDKLVSSLGQSQGDGQAALGGALIGGILADVQFVLLDKNMFLKISGNWYETGNLSDLASGSGVNLGTTSTPSDSTSCVTNALKDTSKFGADKVLKDLQETGTESIDGTSSHHITGNINFDSLLTQVASTSRDCGDAEAAGGIEAAKSQIGALFKTASIEVWISDDNYIRQAKINLVVDPSTVASLLGSLGGTSDSSSSTDQLKAIQSVGLNTTIKQSRFNEDFNITKPQGNIQSLQDLFGATGLGGLGGLGGSSSGTSGISSGSSGDAFSQ